MRNQKVYLKVKLKSLMAEAKIIRMEEKRNKHFRIGLAQHRRTVVRQEARLTYLAYGFLKGKSYDQIEKAAKPPDWDKVKKMVEKYGVAHEDFTTWGAYQDAKAQQLAEFESWKPQASKAA